MCSSSTRPKSLQPFSVIWDECTGVHSRRTNKIRRLLDYIICFKAKFVLSLDLLILPVLLLFSKLLIENREDSATLFILAV